MLPSHAADWIAGCMPQRVVVNADDLGMSPAINRAILDGLEAGWLSDASVLATGPAFAEIRPLLAGRSLGFHADLSEFSPIRGPLPARHGIDFGLTDLETLIAELSAQCERLLDAGMTISHADSHQHLHYQNVAGTALLTVARQFHIPYVRRVSNVPPARIRRRARAGLSSLTARLFGVNTLGAFGPAGAVRTAIELGWQPSSLEVMCHAGHQHSEYEAEIRWLQTRPFGTALTSYQSILPTKTGAGITPIVEIPVRSIDE